MQPVRTAYAFARSIPSLTSCSVFGQRFLLSAHLHSSALLQATQSPSFQPILLKPKIKTIPPYPDLRDPTTPRSLEIEPGVYVHPLCTDGQLITIEDCPFKNLLESFEYGMSFAKDEPCLGKRELDPATGKLGPYKFITYNDVWNRGNALGSSLIKRCSLDLSKENLIGLFGQNSVEWSLTDRACTFFNLTSVLILPTVPTEHLRHILRQTEMRVILLDTTDRLNALLRLASETSPGLAAGPKPSTSSVPQRPFFSLKHVIVFDSAAATREMREQCAKHGLELYTLGEMIEYGSKNLQPRVQSKSEDIYTICYTSGTTGLPKGVPLTHENVITSRTAIRYIAQLWNLYETGPHDRHLSYLPAAHSFEISVQNFVYPNGARMGFYSGDLEKILDDITELKPTVFPTVPRLCNRVYEQAHARVLAAPRIVRSLFALALKRKFMQIKKGIVGKNSIWDRIVFKRFHEIFGGNVANMAVGSAPLDGKVLDFMRCIMGCDVYEGYGLTETCGAGTGSMTGEWITGVVGIPLPMNKIKLVDLPHLNYFVKDRRGEICLKGANCVKGYFRDEAASKELVDKDGWLHTGDVGEVLPNGLFKVIDRVKHAYKLANGEFIAPERIEAAYARSKFVTHSYVHGNPHRQFLVGVIVVAEAGVRDWCNSNGYADLKFNELCQELVAPSEKAPYALAPQPSARLLEAREKLRVAVIADLVATGRNSGLLPYEQAKAVLFSIEPFTVENDLLTPTFKTKRNFAVKRFGTLLDALYERTLHAQHVSGKY